MGLPLPLRVKTGSRGPGTDAILFQVPTTVSVVKVTGKIELSVKYNFKVLIVSINFTSQLVTIHGVFYSLWIIALG